MRLVLVPGFTQTAAAWDPVRDHLPSDIDAVALDVPTGLGFVETAAAIGEHGGRAVYAGYSMGDADEQLARDVERDGVDAFLDRWLRQPLFATLPPEAAGVETRRAGNTVATLTHALRALGPGTQEPLWDRLGDLAPPLLPIAGTLDEKYVDIAFEMAERVGPDVHPVLIGGAGHAVHLEQPEAVAAVLRRFAHDLTS